MFLFFFRVVACAPRSFRRLISHSKRLKTSSSPTRTGRERTAIVQVAPRRLFDRESSWSSSTTTHHHHHRLWKNNNRTTTTFVCSRCFSSRRSRARPTTPRARKTERGEGASRFRVERFVGSTRVLLDDNGFEHDDEASTCDGMCIYINEKKYRRMSNARAGCFTTSYGIHSLELEY